MEKMNNFMNKAKQFWKEIGCVLLFVALAITDAIHCREIEELKAKTANLNKVYVYDVNALISASPEIVALQQNFQTQLADLNKQIDAAQKKLANMKDKAAKAEFSEAYLGGLSLKRDSMIEEYQKSISAVSKKVDASLLQIVEKNGIPVVYNANVVAVKTPNVVNITNEVLQNAQK